ncbi:hypothetical protein FZ103_10895 [Streptomonospora sp. PA3]|uniref:hypothetical protein n=1 Tax=Streptomonospora sp. PA3 TaxID=2607326 RepID=UPI0012DBD0AB|nr:hypothetical protein [Streptomonospora sp. PA3]MUL41673.1 hypothetical protein [Streptomonospora sp. PA3]
MTAPAACGEPEFAVHVDQNRWLPPGGGDVHAVVRVTCRPADAAGGPVGSDPAEAAADVALRLWTPRGASVAAVVQVSPEVRDLTARRVPAGPLTGDYPTGPWGAESRAYHLHVLVPPAEAGRRMRAGRVRPLPAGADPGRAASGDVLAEWAADPDRAAAEDPGVVRRTGRAELSRAVREGLRARRDGDHHTATVRLGRAVALAHAWQDEAAAELLHRVVDVVDAAAGTVRLRSALSRADEAALGAHSTATVRTRAGNREPGAV